MEGLEIKANYDENYISIKSKKLDLNIQVTVSEFAKLSAIHLQTGRKMSELLKELI